MHILGMIRTVDVRNIGSRPLDLSDVLFNLRRQDVKEETTSTYRVRFHVSK